MRKDLITGDYENQIEDAKTAKHVKQLIQRMTDLSTLDDAKRCSLEGDYSGLAYIINMCESVNGAAPVKMGLIFEVCDELRKETV